MADNNERGLTKGKGSGKKSSSSEFRRSLAIIIGIDRYSNNIPPLSTAVNDARALEKILKHDHSYEVILLTDEEADKPGMKHVFLDKRVNSLSKNDRLLFYFAGHGIALDGDNDPKGYLIPQNAEPEENSFWPMTDLYKALDALECRHMLAILDCCFAGAFRWSGTRDFQPLPKVLYRERYERYIRDPAWQVITSAAHNQKALDTLSGYVVGQHGIVQKEEQQHSPFARTLFEALHGAADSIPKGGDGVITAMELAVYLQYHVGANAEQLADHQQTAQLWPLKKHEQGEFIFLVPGQNEDLNLPDAPDLTEENNPYKGLSSYEQNDSELFFGRKDLIKKLKKKVEKQRFTVVLGASGTGKSSLVKAGLLPALKKEMKQSAEKNDTSQASSWFIPKEIMRPGADPLPTLHSLLIRELPGVSAVREKDISLTWIVEQWAGKNPGQKLLLVIDQFEELITLCRQEDRRDVFIRELKQALEKHREVLRIVLTLRSDFESQISQLDFWEGDWEKAYRFIVRPMTQDELREVIEEPASAKVLYFEPRTLIDTLINEVLQTPGALPLLSFTLYELYLSYAKNPDGSRALTEADYKKIGGVIGSLRRRIDHEYEKLDADHQATMKRILLRMIAFEGGELTRRRVPDSELVYPDATENKRVKKVVDILSRKRLIVEGSSENSNNAPESYIEPAHDALIVAWDKLLQWRAEETEAMLLQRKLTPLATDWGNGGGLPRWDSRLQQAEELFSNDHFFLNKLEQNLLQAAKELAEKEELEKQEQERQIRESLKKATEALREANYNLAKVFEEKATAAWNNDSFQQATLFASAALEQEIDPEKSALKIESIKNIFAPEKLALALAERWQSPVAHHHMENVTCAAFCPDGTRIISASEDHTMRLWDIATGKQLAVFNSHTSSVTSVAFSPDGTRIASGSDDSTVRLWDVATGRELNVFDGHAGYVLSVAFSPDGTHIASGSGDNTVRLWDITTGKELSVFEGHTGTVGSVAFSPDGTHIASGSHDSGTVRLWDIAAKKLLFRDFVTGRRQIMFGNHEEPVTSVAFSPDGTRIASGSYDKTVRLWDIATGKELMMFKGHKKWVTSVAFSPDGSNIVSASEDSTMRLWEVATGKELNIYDDHAGPVFSVAFNPDGTSLVSTSRKKTARLWEVATGRELTMFKGHENRVTSVAFSPDGSSIVSASEDNTMRLWEVTTGKELNVFKGHECSIRSIAFSPDGTRIASASQDNTLRLWDIATGREVNVFKGHEEWVDNVAFSPDGTLLASGSNSTVQLWDIASGKEITVVKDHEEKWVANVAFSPDGTLLASGSNDNKLLLWDINSATKPNFRDVMANKLRFWNQSTEQKITVFSGHEKGITSVAFSPDGTRIASSSYDKTVRLWDIATGNELQLFKDNKDIIANVAFSPDGTRIATTSNDKTIQVLNIATGKKVNIFRGHDDSVTSVAFSPDGTRIVSGSNDSTVRLWDVVINKRSKIIEVHNNDIFNHDSILNISFSPDGTYISTFSSGSTVRRWDITTGRELSHFTEYTAAIINTAFSHDGACIALTFKDCNTFLLIDTTTQETKEFDNHKQPVTSVAFNSNSTCIVSGSHDKTLRLWDIASGKEIAVFKGHKEGVDSVAFNLDGTLLASSSGHNTVRLWDIATKKELNVFSGHNRHSITNLTFSSCGTYIASASYKTVLIWDVASARELHVLKGHEQPVNSITFSPDGTILASASGGGTFSPSQEDNTIRIWDVATGRELNVFKGHSGIVNTVVFNPDGTLLASASDDTVRLWDMRLYTLFQHGSKPTPLYHTFMEGVRFLWKIKLDGLEFVPKYYTPTLYAQDGYNFVYDPRFRPLLNPPPSGQSKFDQVLEWAQQQEKNK